MNLRLLVPALALLCLPGCLVRHTTVLNPPPKTKKSNLSSSDCDNNQYWDGSQCRHKGKGKGARKHDN